MLMLASVKAYMDACQLKAVYATAAVSSVENTFPWYHTYDVIPGKRLEQLALPRKTRTKTGRKGPDSPS